MEKIKKTWIMILMMLIWSNLSYSALSISSNKVTIETISTSIGENRVQVFEGSGNIKLGREEINEEIYLGIRVTELSKKQDIRSLKKEISEYDFSYDGITIKIVISNLQGINGNFSDNKFILDNEKLEGNVTFDYTLTVLSPVGKEGRVGLAIVADWYKNMVTNINRVKDAEFIEINLEDNGSLLGVEMGTMDFGRGVKFGINREVAPLKLEIKQNNKVPQNTFVELDRTISLTPTSGVGVPIPVAISLAGSVTENSDGKYLVTSLTNGSPVVNLNVIGETDIKVGQKSGEYKGQINIRITYTK